MKLILILTAVFAFNLNAQAATSACVADGIYIGSRDSTDDLIATIRDCIPNGLFIKAECASYVVPVAIDQVRFIHPADGVPEVSFVYKSGTLKGFLSDNGAFGKMIVKAVNVPANLSFYQALNYVMVQDGCQWK